MNQLKKELSGLSLVDIDDIMRDQEEYFREATNSGRSEASVISSLGDPKVFAQELKAGYQIDVAAHEIKISAKAKSILKAILALCVLAPFNLIFILGPFVVVCATLFALWLTNLLCGILSVIGILISFGSIFFTSALVGLAGFFGCLAVLGLALMTFVVIYHMTEFFLKLMVSFLKWNINFVTGAAK